MKTILLSILILASACASALADTPPIPAALMNQNDVPLGYGYTSHNQLKMGFCVDNADDKGVLPLPVVEEMEGRFGLSLEHDESSVADKLGISGSGRYKTGVTTASLAADFFSEAKQNDYRTSYTFISEHQYRESMNYTRANPIRPYREAAPFSHDTLQWYDHCGDEFVQSRILSARLFVNVSISFVSKEEHDRFSAKFSLDSPTLDLGAQVDKEHSEFSSANRMTVQAFQIGGDSSNLGRTICPATVKVPVTGKDPGIVEDKSDPNCDNSSLAIVKCAFGDLAKCNTMLASAIAYANGHGEGQFGKQIEGRKQFSVTELETMPYSAVVGVFPPAPKDPTLETREAARNNALDFYSRQLKNYQLADALWKGQAPRLSVEQKAKMRDFRADLLDKLGMLAKLVDTCFSGSAEKCIAAYKKTAGDTKLNVAGWEEAQNQEITALSKAETYVQFCDIANDDNRAIQRTVRTLREFVRTKTKKEDFDVIEKNDHCLNEAQWLEAQTTIEIPPSMDPTNPMIGDLGPIAALKHLRVLILTGQSLRDIAPLQNMVDLQELTLDNNLIQNVTPLANLKSLQKLSLQNNEVGSLSPFGKLKGSLRMLDASGNNLEGSTCPLAGPENCQFVSFQNYADVSSAYSNRDGAKQKCDDTVHPTSVAIDNTHILATGGRMDIDRSTKIQLVDNQGCQVLRQGLAAPRIGHTMTMTPNGVLVIGGGTNKIERIDPRTYEVSALPGTLAESPMNHTATLLPDGRVLVVGGANDADPYAAMTHPSALSGLVEIVNTNGTVETIGQLNVPRSEHTATLLQDGRVLIIGGYSLNKMLDIAEIIDPNAPAGQRIKELQDTLPFGRSGHAAMLLDDGHVLIAGGVTWDLRSRTDATDESKKVKAVMATDQMLDFDPVRGKFRVLDEKLPTPLSKIQAVATSDHRVLLIGGMQNDTPVIDGTRTVRVASNLIEVFDPRTSALYKVTDMLNRRIGFTATALPNNAVLIFGGTPSWNYEVTKDEHGNPAKDKNGNYLDVTSQPSLITATELLVYRPR